jgi:hypothetical protein
MGTALVFVTVATKAPCHVKPPSAETAPGTGLGVTVIVTVAVPDEVLVALEDEGLVVVLSSSPHALVKRMRAGKAQTSPFRDKVMRSLSTPLEIGRDF